MIWANLHSRAESGYLGEKHINIEAHQQCRRCLHILIEKSELPEARGLEIASRIFEAMKNWKPKGPSHDRP